MGIHVKIQISTSSLSRYNFFPFLAFNLHSTHLQLLPISFFLSSDLCWAMSAEHIFYHFRSADIHFTLLTFSFLCQYVFVDGCCSFFRLVIFFFPAVIHSVWSCLFFFYIVVLYFLLCSSHTKRRDIFPHCDKYAVHSTSFSILANYTIHIYSLLRQFIYSWIYRKARFIVFFL